MSKSNIQITITGSANSGKTAIMLAIGETLRTFGIDCELFDDEDTHEKFHDPKVVLSIFESISKNTSVKVITQQAKRESI